MRRFARSANDILSEIGGEEDGLRILCTEEEKKEEKEEIDLR